MKVRAPQGKRLSTTGDFEADRVLHDYRAAKKLEKERKGRQWRGAAAAATNRRLLIGNCAIFKPPRS